MCSFEEEDGISASDFEVSSRSDRIFYACVLNFSAALPLVLKEANDFELDIDLYNIGKASLDGKLGFYIAGMLHCLMPAEYLPF